jgi:hypothetical protein
VTESDGCIVAWMNLSFRENAVFRTSWAEQSCLHCDGTSRRVMLMLSGGSSSGAYRVTVPEPWHAEGDTCGVGSACVISQTGMVRLVAGSVEDGPVNVVVETVDLEATCP